jgi:hypothetical protein
MRDQKPWATLETKLETPSVELTCDETHHVMTPESRLRNGAAGDANVASSRCMGVIESRGLGLGLGFVLVLGLGLREDGEGQVEILVEMIHGRVKGRCVRLCKPFNFC